MNQSEFFFGDGDVLECPELGKFVDKISDELGYDGERVYDDEPAGEPILSITVECGFRTHTEYTYYEDYLVIEGRGKQVWKGNIKAFDYTIAFFASDWHGMATPSSIPHYTEFPEPDFGGDSSGSQ